MFTEALADFLLGEGKMELFFEESPPIDGNVSKAKHGLIEAKKYLMHATSDLGKKVRVTYLMSSTIMNQYDFRLVWHSIAIYYSEN